jgi:chaperone BCS1
MSKYGEWMRYNKIPSRTLDTVYFDEKLKQKMRADIMDFLKKEKEYDEFGIPYKKNYLLTGIPGSGKTSIIKAMCKEIGYNLCIFSINHDTDNNTALAAFRQSPSSFSKTSIVFSRNAPEHRKTRAHSRSVIF